MSILRNASLQGDPSDYQPYKELIFCGNHLYNIAHPIELGSNVPLLVGSGGGPKLWLAAPIDPTRETWSYVVEANVSRHPEFVVKITPDGRELHVTAGGKKIIEIKERSASRAEVRFLDLHPIGLRISGDANRLIVGTSTLSGNSASGSGTFLALA